MRIRPKVSAVIIAVLLLTRLAASADEIKVMTSGAFTAAYLELVPEFERATGHRIVTEATVNRHGRDRDSRLGSNAAKRLMSSSSPTQDLERVDQGSRILPGSRVDLARSAIGIAVRRGAPKPDISSVDALRRTLSWTRSRSLTPPASAASYLSTEDVSAIGDRRSCPQKSRRIEGERVGDVVARGKAEIGFEQISELLPITGIDFVGPLPRDVQRVTVFAAGVGAASQHPAIARSLIDFLASPAAIPAIQNSGLEVVMVVQ